MADHAAEHRVEPHHTAGWWVLTDHGWLPWTRVAGLSPLAVELYGLLLRLGEPAGAVTAHPSSSEHASLIVEGWSLADLGQHLGNRSPATVSTARLELEARGLVVTLRTAGGGSGAPSNVYGVVSGRKPQDERRRRG